MEKIPFVTGEKGNRISGIIEKPEGNGPFSALIYCHGFTGDRNESHFLFSDISKALCKIGVGNIRFDFFGSGDSDGCFSEMTLETEVRDLECVYAYVKKLEWVSKISLIGFSMGGAVAGIFAGRNPDFIDTLCLVSPALFTKTVFSRLLEPVIPNIKAKGEADFNGFSVGNAFYQSVMNTNPIEILEKYIGPVKIIQGDLDEIVPFSLNRDLAVKENFAFSAIKGAGHTYQSICLTNELIAEILKFFKSFY